MSNNEDGFIAGQTGGVLLLEVVEDDEVLDISDAEDIEVVLSDNNSNPILVSGTFFTDGEDGVIQCEMPDLPLNCPGIVGTWKACAWLTLGSWHGPSTTTQFPVRSTLKRPT